MSTELYRKLIEAPDLTAYRKAARELFRLWRKTHPRPYKKRGTKELTATQVCDAVETVMEWLKKDDKAFKRIEWDVFFHAVQVEIGNSPQKGKGLYSDSVLRPRIMDHLCAIYHWHELPPKLFARKERWMPEDRLSLNALREAFYANQARLLPPGARNTAISMAPKALQAKLRREEKALIAQYEHQVFKK